MMDRLKILSRILAFSSLPMGMLNAECIDHVSMQDDGTITRAGLVAYNDCMKSELGIPRPPIKLSTSTWSAACSGTTTADGCYGDLPSTNTNTKLVLQVTNIFGLANLVSPNTSPGSYTAGTIWIGTYASGVAHAATSTNPSGVVPASTQGICAAYDETGWPVPIAGMNVAGFAAPTPTALGGGYVASAVAGTVPAIAMLTNPATLSLPLYIICVGRVAPASTPSTLGGSFNISWS